MPTDLDVYEMAASGWREPSVFVFYLFITELRCSIELIGPISKAFDPTVADQIGRARTLAFASIHKLTAFGIIHERA